MKEFTQPSSHETPENDNCDDQVQDEPEENRSGAKSSIRRPRRKFGRGLNKKPPRQSLRKPKKSAKRNDNSRPRGRTKKSRRRRQYHISKGRGANLTQLKVLLAFCVAFSQIEACTAAGRDGLHQGSSHHPLIVFLAALCTCVLYTRMRAILGRMCAEENSNARSMPVYREQTNRGPNEAGSRAVYVRPTRRPPLRLLPGNRTVCVSPPPPPPPPPPPIDPASNSYTAGLGFELPEHPLTLQQLLMLCRARSPEMDMTDQRILQRFSEMVIGRLSSMLYMIDNGGQISSGTRDIRRRGISRTVSLPLQDSSVNSFNADTVRAESDSSDEEMVLPRAIGEERGSVEETQGHFGELVCRPFEDSESESELDSDGGDGGGGDDGGDEAI